MEITHLLMLSVLCFFSKVQVSLSQSSSQPVEATCLTKGSDLPEPSSMVRCPSGCLTSMETIWGLNIYSDDSPVCRAGLHAGAIDNNGGIVSILKLSGQSFYTGITKNGVTSTPYGSWPNSFMFQNVPGSTPAPPVNATCTTTVTDLSGPTPTVNCPSGCAASASSVWGSTSFTDDSSVCAAAIHEGAITDDGGQVSPQIAAGQDSYTGSTRNGIASKGYGMFGGSFFFRIIPESSQEPPVEATCSTTAKDLTKEVSVVRCPSGCDVSDATVHGTFIYSEDSSICIASIHSGYITKDGGMLSVQKGAGQGSFVASTMNGVTTSESGSSSGSFIVNYAPKPPTPEPKPKESAVKISCSTTAMDIKSIIARLLCPPNCSASISILGINIYAGTSICSAAMQKGIIGKNGGIVTIKMTAGTLNFKSSAGIGPYYRAASPASFKFIS